MAAAYVLSISDSSSDGVNPIGWRSGADGAMSWRRERVGSCIPALGSREIYQTRALVRLRNRALQPFGSATGDAWQVGQAHLDASF